jgi:alkane 1-monooxygenase
MPHYFWYYLTYIMPVFAFWGIIQGGWLNWMTPVWVFLLIPIYDHLRGIDKGNLKPEDEEHYSNHLGYNLVVWLWVPLQLTLLGAALVKLSFGNVSTSDYFGMAISVGVLAGAIGITWAHEMCHRVNPIERALAEILLSTVSYAHFSVEHVYGHHKNVATPIDPATSRLGESFYAFYPRTVIGSFVSAWKIEAQQLAKKKMPFLHYKNRMIRYTLVQVALYAAVYAALGWYGVIFFAVQAIVAFTLLELINYLEHYGLVRNQKDNGRYESVQPHHSWNSSQIVSNLSLINLARHSDHHFRAARRYQILRHFEDAPQLPSGYAAMLVLALFPRIWFRIMDPKVKAWREQHHKPEAAEEAA